MPASTTTSRFLIISVALVIVAVSGWMMLGNWRSTYRGQQEGFFDAVVSPGTETSVPSLGRVEVDSTRPQTTAPTRASLFGSVRTEDGAPVPGAVVAWVQQASALVARGFERTPINFSAPRFSTTTDSEGRYGFDLLPLGAIRLGVQPPAESGLLAPEEQVVELKADAITPTLDFTLRLGEQLLVRVTNQQGHPVEAANLNWITTSRVRGTGSTPTVARTDAGGTHRIVGLSSISDLLSIEVRHPEYLDAFRSFDSEPATDSIEIILTRRNILTLAVVDETTGAPVPNYEYSVMATAADQWSFGPLTRASAPDGMATLALTPTSAATRRVVVVELDASGNHTGRRGAAAFSALAPDLPGQVVVMIGPGTTIRGEVRHAETGEPVPGATVRQFLPSVGDGGSAIELPTAFAIEEVTADDAGRFEISGLIEGQYDLIASAPGLRTGGATSVVIDESFEPSADVVLKLIPTGSISGGVTERDGRPAAGYVVDLYNHGARRSSRTRTDAEGRYLFPDASPTDYTVTLWLNESGTDWQQLRFALAPGENRVADFDLSQCVELSGTMWVDGQLWYAAQLLSFELLSPDWNAEAPFSSALRLIDSGRYLVLIPPGEWQLVMKARGAAGGRGEIIKVAATPREQRRDFTVRVGRLRVEILLRGGSNLLPGSIISLAQRTTENGPMVEDVASMILGDGSPVGIFTRLNPGIYRASIYAPGTNPRLLVQSSWVEVLPEQTAVIRLEWRDTDASGMTPVARAQRQIQQLGYDPGPVDGVLGPVTSTALRRLQADNGLRPTGQLDDETIRLLNIKVPSPQ